MPAPSTAVVYRALSRLLPRDFRAIAGAELELAAAACMAREQARFGRLGAAFAWMRLSADLLATAFALRWPRTPPSSPGMPPRGFIETLMDNLVKDFLYAVRGLRRQPGFAALTVLTLALGIGANTAIFSVINGVLLRPLPYPNADQLEYVTSKFPTMGFEQFWMSIPEVLELEQHNQSFSSLGAYRATAMNIDTTPPMRPATGVVTAGFLPTLGVRPMFGRWFEASDSVPGAQRVAILSWELWTKAFGADPQILGKTFKGDTITRTIVGVMPRGFDVHDARIEFWVPAIVDPATLPNNRGSHSWYAVARRKDGVSPAMARADLQQMQTHWKDFVPYATQHVFDPNGAYRHQLRIDPLKTDVVGDISRALLILQGAVAFVLLIACANLANLLLARAETRQREFAVRTALGAGRRRLFAQFVTEGLVLSAMAAAGGIALAWLALRGLLRVNPDAIPRSAEIGLDWRVLLFTLALTVLTGFVFGLAPLSNLGKRLMTSLRDGTRTSGTRAQKIVRGTLVVAEVTLAVVLVAGAGLLVRSLGNLMHVDAGFKRDHLATFRLVLPTAAYGAQQRVDFFARLEDSLRAIPGVSNVASMEGLPPNRPVDANDTDFEYIPNSNPPNPNYPLENVDYWQQVTQRYVDTMGLPIVAGRAFTAGDVTGPPVVLVNEALVRRFFKDREPIGEHIKIPFGPNTPWMTVVGVVKDVKQGGVNAPVGTELYLLVEQQPRIVQFAPNDMNVVIRTTRPLSDMSPQILQTVRSLDASLPVMKLRTLDEVFGDSVSRPRFMTWLLGIFGGLALVLAAIGTYGVLSYLVTQRTKEIGIRMALGANRGDVLGLVLKQGLLLTTIGLVLGGAGALAAGRLMRTLLFDVSPADPITIVAVITVMAVVAAVACLVPALRATRVDPLTTLR
jgi:predicted permease